MRKPKYWKIVKIEANDETYYRILSDMGMGSHDWRLSSLIENIVENEHWYKAETVSSCYELRKTDEKLTNVSERIYDMIKCSEDFEVSIVEVQEIINLEKLFEELTNED